VLVAVTVAVALLDELGLAVAVAVALLDELGLAVALLVPEGVDCALPLGTAVVVGSALELT